MAEGDLSADGEVWLGLTSERCSGQLSLFWMEGAPISPVRWGRRDQQMLGWRMRQMVVEMASLAVAILLSGCPRDGAGVTSALSWDAAD